MDLDDFTVLADQVSTIDGFRPRRLAEVNDRIQNARRRRAAAVVGGVAALTAAVLAAGSVVARSGPDSVGPIDSPTSLPSTASDSARPQHLVDGPAAPLEPGTYQFSVATGPGVTAPDALLEVPSGFDDEASWYVVSPDQKKFLGLFVVGRVARDACTPRESRFIDPGSSVEDLANALVAQKSTRASTPKQVTIGGYDGLYVELASPHDISRCRQTGNLWEGRGVYGDAQVDLVWILDVDGQRLVVNAAHGATASASDIHKLTSMAESIQFVQAAQP